MRRSLPLKHKLGAAALTAVLVLTLVHIYKNVLGGSVGARPMHVAVALKETGGLFVGSGVTYRGVRVGSVKDVALVGDHVQVDVSLNPGSQVPSDTAAVVRSLSPAGEQYLDLQPRRSGGPYLADGARIASSDTSTPTSVADTLMSVDGLMKQVDDEELSTVLHELSVALADPDDFRRVVSSGSELVTTIDAAWPETLRTMQNGRTVLRTGVDTSDDFRSYAGSARSLASWLKGYDPTLRRTITATPAQLKELRTLTNDMVKRLPPLLREFADFTQIFADRDPHVRELLIQFPIGLAKLTDAFTGGRMQTNMLISNGEVCSYGIDDTNPQDTTRQPLDPDRSCPASFAGQQRGSAHAPGPTG
jgi:phospholipid/cholesterol/gamma-HCH transport system substrate-binding protein